MPSTTIPHLDNRSLHLVDNNIAHLRDLFPEAFVDGRLDFDTLRHLLGDELEDAQETYGLHWHGKRKAAQHALTPSQATLRPSIDESIDWKNTQNLVIEGDNLEVLKLLQKSYSRKIKLIYIDPPYNTGKDFIYTDDYQDNIYHYLHLTGQIAQDRQKNLVKYRNDWPISHNMAEHDLPKA